jgi:archaellum component FlaC
MTKIKRLKERIEELSNDFMNLYEISESDKDAYEDYLYDYMKKLVFGEGALRKNEYILISYFPAIFSDQVKKLKETIKGLKNAIKEIKDTSFEEWKKNNE